MAEAIEFDDLADIYDYYVKVDLDIPFFAGELGARKGDVLELMCGTGRVSLPLLKNGTVWFPKACVRRFKPGYINLPSACCNINTRR